MKKSFKAHTDIAYFDTAAEARSYIQVEIAVGHIYADPPPSIVRIPSSDGGSDGFVVYATVDLVEVDLESEEQ